MAYCTPEQIKAQAVPEVDLEAEGVSELLEALAAAASGLIDRYTKRPDSYFAVAATEPADRRYRGEGKRYLAVGRYVVDTLTFTSPTIAETSYYINPQNGWIYHNDTPPNDQSDYWPENAAFFRQDSVYIVSARWGFAATPPEIVTAAALIAGKVFDQGKGVAGEITPSGFVIDRDIPPTAKAILQTWIKREFEIN